MLNNIKFPTTADEISKRQFFRVAGLPNCLGVIDGTLIHIIAPSGHAEPVYVCIKGYHALNVLAVTDANMRITGGTYRKAHPAWFKKFTWMRYSVSTWGLVCPMLPL